MNSQRMSGQPVECLGMGILQRKRDHMDGGGERNAAGEPLLASDKCEMADPTKVQHGSMGTEHSRHCRARYWRNVEYLPCADGKRPTQPGIHPLPGGLPGRVGMAAAMAGSKQWGSYNA